MGSPSRDKGFRFERELVNAAKALGLEAKRAYGSDGRSLGHHEEVDCLIAGLKVQAKRKKSIPKYLGLTEHVDAAAFREDGGETYIMLRYDKMLELLNEEEI